MKYCFKCGAELIKKKQITDGLVPYCPVCLEYRYPMFNAAVSAIIFNSSYNRILLIKQDGKERNILVGGYINKGEQAEEAVRREIMEEVSLKAIDLRYNKSEYFGKSNTLILNYACRVEEDNFKVDGVEVDEANWFTIIEAKEKIAEGSLAKKFMLDYLENQKI